MLRAAINRLSRYSFQDKTSLKCFSSDQSKSTPGGESHLVKILKQRFPEAKCVEVQDISGGCGAMYEIFVETSEFKGLNTVKQHRLITDTLKSEIKDMHGVRIHTKLPSEEKNPKS